jgi:hypothetical protein
MKSNTVSQPFSGLTYEYVIALVDQLSLVDRLRLVAHIASTTHSLLPHTEQDIHWRDPFGLCADLNLSISADEIDDARREMWRTFYE